MATTNTEDPVRTRVAANVRMYRQARRLTLEDLAAQCESVAGLGISAAALLRVEQGKRGVEAGDLIALALALRVGVPDLLAPTFDESQADVTIGDGTTVAPTEYLRLISTLDHVAGSSGQSSGEEAVLVPAPQMQAIASAFAAVGAAAGEAARQFSLITTTGTSLQALAATAGEHARPFGQVSSRLREAGFTTEQLRDRFGPQIPLPQREVEGAVAAASESDA
ncbi:MAG: hypothetical protein QG622_85 [Actinomycetota bacterium]|nr:hypothetical protein [Actinomycetota bacterium]